MKDERKHFTWPDVAMMAVFMLGIVAIIVGVAFAVFDTPCGVSL